jgi:glycosyltransferase involved in cell wall biosynthesis
MNKLISIIIPTYNRETTILNRAVQSVLNQTYKDIEIIVVNDNPTTSSLYDKIFNYCKEIKIKCIFSNGKGAAVARNRGVENAHGDFIAFLDDDDEWLPDKLMLQYALFNEPNVGMVYCRGYTMNTKNPITIMPYATDSYYKTSVTYNDLLLKNYIGTTTQIIVRKSDFFSVGGFDENFPARQDYDLCIRMSKKAKCLGVDDYLFIHYLHDSEQITKNSRHGMVGYKKLLKKFKGDIKKTPDAYRYACYRIAHFALKANNIPNLIIFTVLAIANSPTKYKETFKKIFS